MRSINQPVSPSYWKALYNVHPGLVYRMSALLLMVAMVGSAPTPPLGDQTHDTLLK